MFTDFCAPLCSSSRQVDVLQDLKISFSLALLQDYKPEEDPALFHSAKTDRGPLGPEWKVPDMDTESYSCLSFTFLILILCLFINAFPVCSLQSELKADCPYMCAYKLVTVKFKWWGLQTKVENFIHRVTYALLSHQMREVLYSLYKYFKVTEVHYFLFN